MVLQAGPFPGSSGIPRFTGGIGLDSAENVYFVVYSLLFNGGQSYTLSRVASAGTKTNVLAFFAGQSGTYLPALSSDHAQKIHYWSDYYSYGQNYRSEINFLGTNGNSTLVYQEVPGGGVLEALLADRSGIYTSPVSEARSGTTRTRLERSQLPLKLRRCIEGARRDVWPLIHRATSIHSWAIVSSSCSSDIVVWV